MRTFVALVVCAAFCYALDLTAPANDQSIIEFVNAQNTTWTAGTNDHFNAATLADAKQLCGVKKNPNFQLPIKRTITQVVKSIPAAFDSRTEWGSTCASLTEIRDQSACGSCWAFGAVEAMTDRTCIASSGAQTPHLSAEDMNSCCALCGDGCGGGDPGAAWDYWTQTGVVDGGNYGDGGCDPYTLPPCDHHINGSLPPCPSQEYPTPPCHKKCSNTEVWDTAKHFGASAYQLNSVSDMQTEIMTNGPVEAAFTVYQDFLTYKTGVYRHTTGQELGGHAIKILGWGVWTDGVTPYWTIANSWNTDWGNEGYFLMLRGKDECGIEDDVVAGMPKL